MSLIADKNLVGTTICGDRIYLAGEALVVALEGRKRVASSSPLNGGCREGMKYLYNYSYSSSPLVQNKVVTKMEAPNLCEHYRLLTKELGLPVEQTVAMGTAAKLEERAEVMDSFHGIQVEAIVTAGIDHNGGRAGDPPSYDELTGENLLPPPGTINIMLFIDAQLPEGVLTQAIITATEAKSAALQELQAGSCYSRGLATGSGTDTIMVVSNLEAPTMLYDAGLHSCLGSTIGRVVKEAVQKALKFHGIGMTPQRQGSLLWQGKRFGITREVLEKRYIALYGVAPQREQIDQLLCSKEVIAYIAPLLHLREQMGWGLIPKETYQRVLSDYFNAFIQSQGKDPLASLLVELIKEL